MREQRGLRRPTHRAPPDATARPERVRAYHRCVRLVDRASIRLPQPWRTIVDWLVTLAVAVAFVLAFQAEIAKPYRIPSSSMEPTLHCAQPGAWCRGTMSDRVIANRLAYRFREPRRSDPGSAGSWRVPPGNYFFLGVNRAHS